MQTTLERDEELLAQAMALADPGIEQSELLNQCMSAFIRQQTARGLAALGGMAPDFKLVPRRRRDEPDS
jgi:hypothetical protein